MAARRNGAFQTAPSRSSKAQAISTRSSASEIVSFISSGGLPYESKAKDRVAVTADYFLRADTSFKSNILTTTSPIRMVKPPAFTSSPFRSSTQVEDRVSGRPTTSSPAPLDLLATEQWQRLP